MLRYILIMVKEIVLLPFDGLSPILLQKDPLFIQWELQKHSNQQKHLKEIDYHKNFKISHLWKSWHIVLSLAETQNGNDNHHQIPKNLTDMIPREKPAKPKNYQKLF